MKIFITGITGFVGGAMANHFIQQGHTVTGIGRRKALPTHVDKRCNYLPQDITKPLLPIEADIVIHAAAITSDKADYKTFYNANTLGTMHVINACKNVQKFILISTSSVYAFCKNTPYKEEEAGENFDQLSAYGKTKLLAEKELLKSKKFEQVFILRPRAIYGVGDTVLLPRLLKLVKGNKLILPASISKQISLTHIDSLVNATALCLQNTTHKQAIYNIADEVPYCLKTCIKQLTEAALQRQLTVVLIPRFAWKILIHVNQLLHFIPALTKFGSRQLTNTAVLDITNAIRNVNYRPTNNFEEISKEVGVWYRSHK